MEQASSQSTGGASAGDAPEAALRTQRTTRRRWVWLVPAALFLGALVVSGIVASTSQRSSSVRPSNPKAAPQFQLVDLRDPTAQVALSDFRGRPVVVNFWASWCVPCRKEMPALEAVYEKVKDRIAFVGVNHRDARGDALAFLRETRVRYPVGFDPDGNTATAYGLVGIPTTIFIDESGREVERSLGKLSQDELQQTLDRLFPAKDTSRRAAPGAQRR
jgi:cytochrome c biogenesis protein CcmG/thiol:disulfide interchange protein DsbE